MTHGVRNSGYRVERECSLDEEEGGGKLSLSINYKFPILRIQTKKKKFKNKTILEKEKMPVTSIFLFTLIVFLLTFRQIPQYIIVTFCFQFLSV